MLQPSAVIFGGCGFLGRNLANELLDRGYHVICADLRHDKRLNIKASFELVDVTSPPSVEGVVYKWADPAQVGFPFVAPPSIAFHVAAIIPSGDWKFTGLLKKDRDVLQAVNSDGAAIVAEMARHHGYTSMVFCSSAGVYNDQSWHRQHYEVEEQAVPTAAAGAVLDRLPDAQHFVDAYAWSKRSAELHILRVLDDSPARRQQQGVEVAEVEPTPPPTMVFTCVRPVGIYGPGDDRYIERIEQSAMNGEFEQAFAVDSRLDFSHVSNVVRLMVQLAEATVQHASDVKPPGKVQASVGALPAWAPKGVCTSDTVLVSPESRFKLHGQAFNVADGLRVNHGVMSSFLAPLGFQCSWDTEYFFTVEDARAGSVTLAAVAAGIANGSLDATPHVLHPSGELTQDLSQPDQLKAPWPVVSAARSIKVHQIVDPFKFVLTYLAALRLHEQRPADSLAQPLASAAAEQVKPKWWTHVGPQELCCLPHDFTQRVHLRSRVTPGATIVPLFVISWMAIIVEFWVTLPAAMFGLPLKAPMSIADIKWCAKTITLSTHAARSKVGYVPPVPCPAGMLTMTADAQRRGANGHVPEVPFLHWLAMLVAVLLLGVLAWNPRHFIQAALGENWAATLVTFLAPYALCFLILAHYREAGYAYSRALAWRQNAISWWRRAFVFGYPFSSGVQEHAHSAHKRIAALIAAYRSGASVALDGDPAFDAGVALTDKAALKAFDESAAAENEGALHSALLQPAAVLTPLVMSRCCMLCVVHLALTSGVVWVVQQQDTSALLPGWAWVLARAVTFVVLERAWFRADVMFT